MKVYCYSKCSTCQKALKYLDEKGIKYELIDIKAANPNSQEIESYYHLSGLPLKRFYNTSGLVYKNNHLKDKIIGMSESEQFALLASDGMLVKRPLVVGNDFVLLGFKVKEWDEKFDGSK